jgi:RNA polymerase sigma factor (sigma-70 family)
VTQDEGIAEVFTREGSRLRRFIRRRVPDAEDADDILQDVFSALVEANRLLVPIDHATGWLFRAARNRVVDLFRRRKPEIALELALEDLLPSADADPDAAYQRTLLLEAVTAAIEELSPLQREVFIAHEIEGRSFKEIAAASGVGVNTLLSRKRQAVIHLRERLRDIYDDLTNV